MLDNRIRGALDQIIDQAVSSLPSVLPSLREGKRDFHVENDTDYALGLAHGMITSSFLFIFNAFYNRQPTQAELIEVKNVFFIRTRELREAIFKGG
jgi:hypothetical protein